MRAAEVHLKERKKERKKEKGWGRRRGLGSGASDRRQNSPPWARGARRAISRMCAARASSGPCGLGGRLQARVRFGRAGIVRPCGPALFRRPAGLWLLPPSSAASASSVVLFCFWFCVSAFGGSGAGVDAICCFGVVGLVCMSFPSTSLSAGSVLPVGGFSAAAAVFCCSRCIGHALRGRSVGAVVGPFHCSLRSVGLVLLSLPSDLLHPPLSVLWSGYVSGSAVGGSGAVVAGFGCFCRVGSAPRGPSVGAAVGLFAVFVSRWVWCCCLCRLLHRCRLFRLGAVGIFLGSLGWGADRLRGGVVRWRASVYGPPAGLLRWFRSICGASALRISQAAGRGAGSLVGRAVGRIVAATAVGVVGEGGTGAATAVGVGGAGGTGHPV